MLRLRRFIPADQFVVIPVIIILVLRDPGVLGYELLYLAGQQVQICAEPVPLLFQGFCVSEPFLQQGDAVKYVRFVFDEPVGGPDEGFLDIILCQMWCLAMALELIVASVDGPAVLVGRMPHLGPVPAAALAALDFAGEDGYAAVTSPAFTPPLDFFLHPVEDLWADDGFVVKQGHLVRQAGNLASRLLDALCCPFLDALMLRQLVRQAADRLFRRRHLGLHGPQAGIDAPHRGREQIPQPDGGIHDVIGHAVSPSFPSSALFICLIFLLSASFHAKMWQIAEK